MIDVLLSVLLSLPVHFTDRDEPVCERHERMHEVAKAIHAATERATGTAWRGTRSELAAALITLGKHESHFAGYVGSGDCLSGPSDARCDLDPRTGQPRARSYWQIWQVAWPPLWRLEPGTPEALQEAAYGAAVRWAGAWYRCRDRAPTSAVGAFAGYGGASCVTPKSTHRAVTWHRVLRRIRTPPGL